MRRIPLFILLLSLFGISCSPTRTYERLNDISNFIQDCPDSALAILSDIDTSSIISRRAYAKYSLLKAMALDKNYIDTANTCIVMPAVDYYRRKGPSLELFQSLYYLGRAYYNSSDYDKAILAYTEAYQFIDKVDDNKAKGLLCNSIADSYIETYNDADALKYVDEAKSYYSHQGLELYLYGAEMTESVILSNLGQWKKADSLFRKMANYEMTECMRLEYFQKYAFFLASTPERSGNYRKIKDLYDSVLQEQNALSSINDWSVYAYVISCIDGKECGDLLFDRIEDLPESDVFLYWKSLADEKSGEYKKALEEYRQYAPYRDSIFINALKQQAAKVQRDFFRAEGEMLLERSRNARLSLFVVVFLFVISFFVIILLFNRHNNKVHEEFDRMAEISEQVKVQLRNSETELNSMRFVNDKLGLLQSEYSRLYKEKFRHVGLLCERYIQSINSSNPEKHLFSEVKSLLNNISTDFNGQTRFEKLINENFDNIMKDFRADFPNAPESDILFVSYSFAGFSASTIIVLLDYPSKGSVYTKKDRIKKMISSSTSTRKQQYLDFLS